MKESIERAGIRAKEKGINIDTQLVPEAIVMLNPKKFIRVIDNLLSNAIKFSPSNKDIRVTTEKVKSQFMLTVEDKGIGIPRENIPSLFDKFSKNIRRRGTQGELPTGLGLAIVKQIVDMHHGKIQVDSKVNSGTAFKVTLQGSKKEPQHQIKRKKAVV